MTFTEIFEAIAEATGIEYSHFSVLGRIWDLADYYGVERRGKLVSQVLRELPQLVNRSPESNLISDLLNLTMRYSKYLSLTGAYSQETTTGANLLEPLPTTDGETKIVNGVSITQNNMNFIISGTSISSGGRGTFFAKALLPAGRYYFSGETTNENAVLCLTTYNTSEPIKSGAGVFKLAEETEIGFGFNFVPDITYNENVDVQINIGTTSLPYEPYTGGAPSPNPDYAQEMQAVEISELKSRGRNLFDQSKFPTKSAGGATVTNNGDGSFTISGSGELSSVLSIGYIFDTETALNLLKVGNLYLKETQRNTVPYFIYGLYNSIGNAVNIITNLKTNVDTTNIYITQDDLDKLSSGEYKLRTYIYGINGRTITPTTIKPMFYQDGDGTFEPYVSDTVTLDEPLILRALPNGVADTYEDGAITRRVGVVEFDGSSDEKWSFIEKTNGFNVFTTILSNALKSAANFEGLTICNRFVETATGNFVNPTENGYVYYGVSEAAGSITFIFNGAIDLDSWKTYLQSNPITVWYQLATPTTEALDIDLEWYGMENFWTDSELDPNMTWKGVSTGVD